jgi:hypothetical protein
MCVFIYQWVIGNDYMHVKTKYLYMRLYTTQGLVQQNQKLANDEHSIYQTSLTPLFLFPAPNDAIA